MDLWVVAAAAGAGFIAKNLPNFSVDKKESPGGPSLKYSYNLQPESRNFLQQLRDKTCRLRRLAQKTVQDDIFLDLENHSDVEVSRIDRSSSWDMEASVASVNDLDSEKTGILEYGDGENKTLSSIHGGKSVRNRRCRLHPSTSTLRPVLVTDASWEEMSLHHRGSGDCAVSSRSSCPQGAESMLLFISGMTVGILTATTSWRDEVNKLSTKLNQMQSLHEELDLKGDPPSGEEDGQPSMEEQISFPDGVKEDDEMKEDNLELLSRIEAELQAELEMLEKNINTSDMERMSSFLEVDIEPEIVRGDLKATMAKDDTSKYGTTTDATTDCSKPANYAVPPWELSLRLHELIESRLEARIRELEMALSQSENSTGRRSSDSGTDSSSAHHSPTSICNEHEQREDEPSIGESGSKVVDQGTQNGDDDSISQHGVITEEDRSPNLVQDMLEIWDKQRMMSLMSNEDSMSEDEGSDESEMFLIKQILERRRSGSSFNFKID